MEPQESNSFKSRGSHGAGNSTEMRVHDEIHSAAYEFPGYFRLGILRGTKRKEVVKNKLDPREHSEPNRIFSRDKSRLCMDLSVLFKSVSQ